MTARRCFQSLTTLFFIVLLGIPSSMSAQKKSIHKIVVRVNGSPITNLDIKQRTNLIMMSAPDIQAKVRNRAKRSFKGANIQKRFRAFMTARRPRTRAEAQKLQKQFARQIYSQAQDSVRGGLRTRALSELIDDQLKMQEAKKRGLLLGKDEVDEIIKKMAKNNKMSLKKFKAFLRARGVHPNAIKSQMRARISWQRVAGARLRREVTVRTADIDNAMAADPANERGKDTQFDLRQIILPSKKAFDTTQYELARTAFARFKGCSNVATLAKSIKGAKFKNLGKTLAGTLPDNARPLLLATPVGRMAPPVFTPRGISLYAVCDRKEVDSDDKLRQTTKLKLQNKQIGTLAKRLLKDLCQEAYIDPPVTNGSTARCGES